MAIQSTDRPARPEPIAGQSHAAVRLARTTRGGSHFSRQRRHELSLGYAMLAPAVIVLAVFELFPVLYGVYISACDWRLQCAQVVGLDNYTRALTTPSTWHSLLVTATYSLISVPLQLGLGLGVAYLLYQKVRARSFFRVVFFLPYITRSESTRLNSSHTVI